MTEDVIQYIWKTQSFNKADLKTTKGESLKILQQGIHNSDSGPDFSSARIIIDNVEWIGDVEIHKETSSWKAHNHHNDRAYNKVILHVVWDHDAEAVRADNSEIPTLELSKIISKIWLLKCSGLLNSIKLIPCENFIRKVDKIHQSDAFSKALMERLERKSKLVLEELKKLKGDWEQTSIILLFEYFGFKKNNDALKQLASQIDYKIVGKLDKQQQIEAYLFGMAGFLLTVEGRSEYEEELIQEFNWIKHKYNITKEPMSATWWKFMRLRPANFPSLRIGQLSALLYQKKHFFQSLINKSEIDVAKFFEIKPSEFWRTHYHFNKRSSSDLKGIGEMSQRILSINVAAVLLVAYGLHTNNDSYIEKAIGILESQKPEMNSITKRWTNLDVKLLNAADTQGAIELFNNYCGTRRCLQCNIGSKILRNT